MKPEIDPGCGGTEHNPDDPLPDVLSDLTDLVPDRGAPDTDVNVDPGGRPHGIGAPTKPNVAVHLSYKVYLVLRRSQPSSVTDTMGRSPNLKARLI